MTSDDIKLPKVIEQLLEADAFEIEDSMDDQLLSKYLYYMPEVIRIYSLVVIQQKKEKKEAFDAMELRKAYVLSEIALSINAQKFKAEDTRNAVVLMDKTYQELKKVVDDIDYEISKTAVFVRKFENLKESLMQISKHRTGSRY